MKPLVLTLTLTLAAAPAAAGCKVEYKAKRDDPLRLEYGIVEIPQSACTPEAAREHVEKLLAGRGWTLLKILSVRSEE
ncbi:hypothetical protein SAMN05216257_101366 [Meinhardsimonia xiamenensis]|jgi:hypothetical protein|uniref:DUF4177 domain-containing protein n=1 Tax=Meinhardsimonia xiamenensis TaxID=990712 RepID=A0A1G8YLC9_9RHOB|nr:hypothetical protein [Meinhardsimonia xiamenensis]PRX37343.1 hypothetical protein LV81_01121 [Meinhardsimonia xiamenensis]SDK03493.1 hypothetical protein SAMN05216257_101366 [Meinhardsimonia xiamenensis]